MAQPELDPEARRIGATIRALRRAHGLQITELARAVNISRPYLSNIEKGRKKATPALCISIAETLGVPTAAITIAEYDRIAGVTA